MTDLLSRTQVLIDRAHGGDEAARQQLLEHYRDYLRRMVAVRLDRRLAARVDVSDVVQETLVEAARRLDDYLRERPLPFYGWLRQLAGERIVDTHRRHVTAQRRSVTLERRDPDLPDASAEELVRRLFADNTSPSNHLMRQERHERLKRALASLPHARSRGAGDAAPRAAQHRRDRRHARDQRAGGEVTPAPRPDPHA